MPAQGSGAPSSDVVLSRASSVALVQPPDVLRSGLVVRKPATRAVGRPRPRWPEHQPRLCACERCDFGRSDPFPSSAPSPTSGAGCSAVRRVTAALGARRVSASFSLQQFSVLLHL